MKTNTHKDHWEQVYQNKQLSEVSWYQPNPQTSLHFIEAAGLAKNDAIIDVGGGDSFLADHLLDRGYSDVTVLDISETSISRAKKRLGEKAGLVKWIVADASDFHPDRKYALWHDRAAFHFLTEEEQIKNYVATVENFILKNGHLIIGTFSKSGPEKCSGLQIQQYDEESMCRRFERGFNRLNCMRVDHLTPSKSIQNFLFCSFQKN